jgi:hypothetical protein
MTADEQRAALGRLITRYAEARTRRAALVAVLTDQAQAVESAARVLAGVNVNTAFADGRQDGYARTPRGTRVGPYLEATKANELLAELETVSLELRELRGLVKDAGLSVD